MDLEEVGLLCLCLCLFFVGEGKSYSRTQSEQTGLVR